jgi:hypothetical protein
VEHDARSRLRRWARDPLVWLAVISTAATLAVAGAFVGVLGPGLEHMESTESREKRVADLSRKLAQAEAEATPPPGDMGAALRDPSQVPARPPAVRPADEDPEEDDWGGLRPARMRREERTESLRRQIGELEHLEQALNREQRQLRRQTREDGAWDPDGHRRRQLRLADIYEELERVEADRRHLERQLRRE